MKIRLTDFMARKNVLLYDSDKYSGFAIIEGAVVGNFTTWIVNALKMGSIRAEELIARTIPYLNVTYNHPN